MVLRQYATAYTDSLLAGIHAIAAQAPFRHMQTPGGGYTMSVAMTNGGTAG
jgi:alkylated DNA repair protein (DNA oxidative demethylase)